MKKIALLFLIVFLAGLFLPQVTLAGEYKADGKTIHYRGLVPCGKSESAPASYDDKNNLIEEAESNEVTMTCQFCHFFVMFDGIVDFVLRYVVPPIAVLMLVIGGIMFYFAGGNPNLVTRGKGLIKAVVIGLFLAYGAFMLVGTVLKIIGVAEWTGLQKFTTNFIFTINCKITL